MCKYLHLENILENFPVGWDCRIHSTPLQRGKTSLPNTSSGCHTKLSDGEATVLEFGECGEFPSLLSGPLWSRVVVFIRVPSMGQLELLNFTTTSAATTAIIIYIYSLRVFRISVSYGLSLKWQQEMVFHWSLSDSKSPGLFSVFWMVFIRPVISKSASPFTNSSVTVPRAPITIGLIITFIFQFFFNFPARSRYLTIFSILLCSQPEQQSPQFCKFTFFFFFQLIYYKFWSSGWD